MRGLQLLLAQLNVPGMSERTSSSGIWFLGLLAAALLLFLFFSILIVRQYKRCPSNRILVVYGRVGKDKSSKCMHGGGTFVLPLVQDYAYLSLEPIVIEVPLEGALSLNNIRVNAPATFTVGVSTDPIIMQNAAERLLNLHTQVIREQAQDIILGQLRLVIATMSIEEINKDREKFMDLINKNVAEEINKIGLELINVNIRDITDESGYIQAIGRRAAADAINRAKVEVAEAEREGATGEAAAVRDKEVRVAAERASGAEGQKLAEQKQRVAIAALEATAVQGEAQAQRDREITLAQRAAETLVAQKQAEQEKRIRIAEAEAQAVLGENSAKQRVVQSQAELAEAQAEGRRRSEIAAAKASEAVLQAQREQEVARLAKEEIAPQEIEKQRIEIAAEAEAEKRRREARGEADAVLAKYEAEAKGVQMVMEAKAEGYRKLIQAAGSDPAVGPTLLLIEQLPKLVEQQVKAVQGLKIDKITVWDQGTNAGTGRNATADFVSGIVGVLPKLHELAAQAGIELPPALGKLNATDPGARPASHRPAVAKADTDAGSTSSAAPTPPPVPKKG
jgi:flotillin